MKNRNQSKALKEWLAAEERIVAADRKFSAEFLNMMFGPESKGARQNSSPPCINVTPPKQPPKK